jgi:pimeloyl-ACP methyl ester carboxylesterase
MATDLPGEGDEIIPLEMGRAFAQLDPSRIRFVTVPGAHHNDVVEKALPLGPLSALSNGEL